LGKIIEGYRINVYSSSQDIEKDEPLEVRYRFNPEDVKGSGVNAHLLGLSIELDDGYDIHLDKNLNKAIYFLDHADGWTLWEQYMKAMPKYFVKNLMNGVPRQAPVA